MFVTVMAALRSVDKKFEHQKKGILGGVVRTDGSRIVGHIKLVQEDGSMASVFSEAWNGADTILRIRLLDPDPTTGGAVYHFIQAKEVADTFVVHVGDMPDEI